MKCFIVMFFSIFMIAFSSCKKFLQEKPNKSRVVIQSLEDLQALLDLNSRVNRNTPGFGETSADDYFIPLRTYNSFSSTARKAYVWDLRKYDISNDWEYGYLALYPVNYCLEKIDEIKKTDNNKLEWNNVKGSALFYRAFWFLCLTWEYGKAYDENTSQKDLGIVLRMTTDINKPSKRSSVAECYERIIKDCKQSVQYLPSFPLHVMRPSKTAAFALLARTYLSMRMYDSAFKYVDKSLNLKNDLLNYAGPDVNPSSLSPFKPFNKEIIFYATMSPAFPSLDPTNFRIDTSLFKSYNKDDLRRQVYFYKNEHYYSFKGNYNANNRFRFFSGLATDEMYLIRAECYARLGKASKAIQDLNTLLKNRWILGTFSPLPVSTPKAVLDVILKERRKELLMRGIRWSDIKRLNLEGRNIILKRVLGTQTFILPPNDNRYALPLPTDIIQMTGMKQNPY